MNYEQLRRDAHTLYLNGHLGQTMALAIMGLKPSKHWIVTKVHEGIHWLITTLIDDLDTLNKRGQ